jgi:hypothetical protein
MDPLVIPGKPGLLHLVVGTGKHEGGLQVATLQTSRAEVANIAVCPVNLDREGMSR